ncbi:MAG TPA: NAD(P)H-hydrate dehydratase [Cellulomonas sp.]
MILGYTAADVRAAEQPLLAEGVPLMTHAAFALATRVAAELAVRRAGTPGGAVRGAGVVLLVGAGNNGGDALHAGAYLAGRGAAVLAVCTTDEPHAEGLAALRRAGGRAVRVTEPVGAAQAGGGSTATEETDVVAQDAAGPARTTTASMSPVRSERSEPGAGSGAGPGGGPDATAVSAGRPGAAVRARHAATLSTMWAGDAVAEAYGADVVLDGLLGIGGRGAPCGSAGLLVGLLRDLISDESSGTGTGAGRTAVGGGAGGGGASGAGEDGAEAGPLVVAVDLPSGIGVDDGTLPDGPVLPADLTVTFGAAKPGLLLPPADGVVGRLQVVDLALPLGDARPAVARLSAADVAALWPVPGPTDHKYRRGVLGVVAGTAAYPGAAVLTVSSAVLAGVGMVRYVGPETVGAAVLAVRPEVVVGSGRVQAWLLGPGVDPRDADQAARVTEALAAALHDGLPAVLDAGALALAPRTLAPRVVLTPHAGELATLLTRWGDAVDREAVEAAPVRWARRAQEISGATVLLKGATTVVVGHEGAVYAQAEAPAWLATAGAGDVLAGVVGALLAGRTEAVLEDPSLAAALAAAAASVHGRAATTAVPDGPVTALAVAHALPATVAAVLRG